MKSRGLYQIPPDELLNYGVWEFDLDEGDYEEDQDETWVYPITDLPVDDLGNRVVFTKVTLANGRQVIGMLGNVTLQHLRKNREFLCLSVEKDGEWFHLERYFDAAYDELGPPALAEFLGLSLDQVFPIRYDISSLAEGLPEVLVGEIPAEPEVRLTDEENMALLFEPDIAEE